MRPYYSFVTGIAGWLGFAYYQHLSQIDAVLYPPPSLWRSVSLLVLLFLSWGVNQIINDFLGLKEDRINAPHRPMVTGALPVGPALSLSVGLMVLSTVYAWWGLNPWAAGLIWVGAGFNVLYNFSKATGLGANLVFGLMISVSTLFGFVAAGEAPLPFHDDFFLVLMAGVALLNGLLTYYTYFKDYHGDRQTGQNTLVVQLGLERARYAALVLSLVPVTALVALKVSTNLPFSVEFLILATLTTGLHVTTGVLFFRHPQGRRSYTSLKANFQAGVCGQAAMMALFTPWLGSLLFVVSFLAIHLLFNLHQDEEA